ncbi:MAG TPA: tetratricopeptide repeat protein [Chthoniobacteraceae bacterium]|jgi:TolA-binding protein
MKRRPRLVSTLVAAGLAAQLAPAFAQKPAPGNPADLRKPFRLDETRPVPRAVPVERPIPRAIPVERPAATPAPAPVPDPTPSSTPTTPKLVAATPKPQVAPTPAAAQDPEPDEPGTIRVGPTATAKTADQVQLEIADGFYVKKMFEQAAPEYERYLGMFAGAGERATALFRLGESYRRTGSLNGAKNSYETLLDQFTTGDFIGPAAFRLAEIYYQDKQYREALPLYRKASVRLKEPAVANAAKFYTGRCLEALGQKMDARTSYEDLLASAENNPFYDASRLSLALLLKDSGRTADALKQIQALAKQTENPDLKIEATVRGGLWMIDLEQNAKAEKELKEAAEMSGNAKWREVARIGLLRLQYNTGKFDQVVKTYAEVGAEFSAESKAELLILVANAHRQLSKPDEARKLYDQVLKDFPNTAQSREAQFERLKMLYYSDDPSLGVEIDKYLVTNPEAPERDQATLMRAESFFKKQDYQNAVPLYSALELSRTLTGALKAEALFKLGFCYLQLKDIDRGIKAFSAFIDQNPTHKSLPYALIQRGLAQQGQKSLPAALKDYDQLISKFPKAKERELALQQKGLILGQQGDTTGMADAFKTLLKDYPQTPAKAQANYWIGSAAFEAKNYKEAIEPLRTARELDKEEYFEKASFLVLLAAFNLEDRVETSREIDIYAKGGKEKVPAQILRWLGTELYKEDSFEKAESYFAMLTPRDEAAPNDFLFLGRSRLKLGKFKESAEALRSYLGAVKEPVPRATGQLELAQALIGTRDFDAAQKAADEALSLQPEGALNGEGRITAGDIQMARGNFPEAAKLYRSVSLVIDDETVTPRALEKSVAAYKKAGDEAEAKKTLNLLQSRYPEYYQRSAKAP